MKGIIVLGGKIPAKNIIKHELVDEIFVIAADSGYSNAKKLFIPVDIVIGDMDSIQENVEASVQIEKHPVDKDLSDAELAIEKMISLRITSFIIIGGGEGRIDHSLSIFLTVKKTPPLCWYTQLETIYFVESYKKFFKPKGSIISILSLSNNDSIVTSNGLKWNLTNYILNTTRMSLSNKNISENFDIKTEGAPVFVIIQND